MHRPGRDDQVFMDADLVVLNLRRVLENDRVDDRGLGLLDVRFALVDLQDLSDSNYLNLLERGEIGVLGYHPSAMAHRGCGDPGVVTAEATAFGPLS